MVRVDMRGCFAKGGVEAVIKEAVGLYSGRV